MYHRGNGKRFNENLSLRFIFWLIWILPKKSVPLRKSASHSKPKHKYLGRFPSASMELEQSPVRETERKPSHKSKKRKYTDSEQRASSKKRKHIDTHLEHGPDTGTPTSKPKTKKKTKSQPVQNAVQSPLSSPPVPASLPDPNPDHDTSIIDAPEITNDFHTITSTSISTSPNPPTSPFLTTITTLLLPLPPIALSPTTALPSLLTTHLTPSS